jgi:hypothetical protein
MDDCVHYWVVDSPNGKTSWGQCTACLVRREFQNAIGDQGWDWPAKNSLDWEAPQQRSEVNHRCGAYTSVVTPLRGQ